MTTLADPILRKRGDTKRIVVQMIGKKSGEPIDVVGWSALLTADTLKEPPDDTTKQFQITGVILSPTTDGKIAFTPLPADVDRFDVTLYFDVQTIDANTEKDTPLDGKIKFKQDITKD